MGATHVFSQPADGYTVGVFTANIISVHIMRGNAKYDRAEFEPIAAIIGYGQVLAANKDAPYNNLAELAEHAKSNEVTLGVVGLNAPPALQVRKMAETMGFEFASIAGYDEASCQLLFNGEVDVLLGGATMRPCMASGEAKGLAALTTGHGGKYLLGGMAAAAVILLALHGNQTVDGAKVSGNSDVGWWAEPSLSPAVFLILTVVTSIVAFFAAKRETIDWREVGGEYGRVALLSGCMIGTVFLLKIIRFALSILVFAGVVAFIAGFRGRRLIAIGVL